MVFLWLGFLFWSSQCRFAFLIRVTAHVLRIWENHWASWTFLPRRVSQNLHSCWYNFIHQNYNFNGYLSPPTWLFTVTIGVAWSLACIIHVLKTLFSIWIWDSKPVGIWTQISGTKSSFANHWATLHWLFHCFFLFLLSTIYCC